MRTRVLAAALLASSPAVAFAQDVVTVDGSISLGAPPPAPAPAPPPVAPAPAPAPAPEAVPVAAPATSEPPPRSAAGVHLHDGFYLRFGFGGGGLTSKGSFVPAAPLGGDTIKGGGLSSDIAIGAAVRPGLTIGGAVLLQFATHPKLTWDSGASGSSNDVSFGIVGPFLDWHLDPRGGFHLGVTLGMSEYDVDDPVTGSTREHESGLGLSPHVGYDLWIGEQWSIGLLARVYAASASASFSDGSKNEHSVTGGSLLVSILYQ